MNKWSSIVILSSLFGPSCLAQTAIAPAKATTLGLKEAQSNLEPLSQKDLTDCRRNQSLLIFYRELKNQGGSEASVNDLDKKIKRLEQKTRRCPKIGTKAEV